MREQHGVGDDVAQADEVVVDDVVAHAVVVDQGDDLPEVVGVVVRVAGDLLALARDAAVVVAKRVTGLVAVEVGLGLLVAQGDGVVVVDGDGVGEHDVVAQCLLELGRHEVVAGAGAAQYGKVHLEPEQVEDEGHDNEAEGARTEVLGELAQAQRAVLALDVQQVPEVDDDGRADAGKGKDADVLCRDVAREREARQDQPLPPLTAERGVPQLVEADVAEQRAGHGEDERGVQQDQPRLADVRVVQQDEARGQDARGEAVAALPHDQVRHRHGQGPEDGRHGAEGHIRDLVRDVRVADVVEVEVAVVPDQPAHEGKQELTKGRVDIEEVRPLQVVGGELCHRLVSFRFPPRLRPALHTFPKWTSSNTTSFGWLMPQNLVTKASTVMMANVILYSRSDPAAALASSLFFLTSLSSSLSEAVADDPSFFNCCLPPATCRCRTEPCGVAVPEAIVRPPYYTLLQKLHRAYSLRRQRMSAAIVEKQQLTGTDQNSSSM